MQNSFVRGRFHQLSEESCNFGRSTSTQKSKNNEPFHLRSCKLFHILTMSSSELKVTFSDKMNKYQYDGHANQIPLSSMSAKKDKGKLYLGDRDSCSMVQLKHRDIWSVVNAQGDMHGLAKEGTSVVCDMCVSQDPPSLPPSFSSSSLLILFL